VRGWGRVAEGRKNKKHQDRKHVFPSAAFAAMINRRPRERALARTRVPLMSWQVLLRTQQGGRTLRQDNPALVGTNKRTPPPIPE
jgi:hypothetical protein